MASQYRNKHAQAWSLCALNPAFETIEIDNPRKQLGKESLGEGKEENTTSTACASSYTAPKRPVSTDNTSAYGLIGDNNGRPPSFTPSRRKVPYHQRRVSQIIRPPRRQLRYLRRPPTLIRLGISIPTIHAMPSQ